MGLRNSTVAGGETAVETGERDGCAAVAVYSTVEQEYACVRNRVGLQDLTHYGKLVVKGDAAMDLVNHLIMTDLARLPINQLQSSFLLDEEARPVCELTIANLGDQYVLLTEGAEPASVARRLIDAAPQFPGTSVIDRSDELGLLSVDGPYAWELLKAFLGLGIIGTRYLEVVPHQAIGGVDTMLARAGKTGEYGYLLMCDAAAVVTLWQALREAGARFEALPIGTRTADLCKLENRVISLHHEGSAIGNVLELNTRIMLARDKDDHVGRAALQPVLEEGVARRLVGITLPEALPAEQPISSGARLRTGAQDVGMLVNTGYSPALKRWIGLALIDEAFACAGVEYDVDTPVGSQVGATVSAPFLFNRSMTIRPQEDSYFS